MNTAFDFPQFKAQGEAFHKNLVRHLRDFGLPVEVLISDHLCFRVATVEEYEFYKSHLQHSGRLLIEAPINGRRISTFELFEPFETNTHRIPLIELPEPKRGVSYQTGFEHAEFVIKESFAGFAERYPHLNFVQQHNLLNPELSLHLQGMQAKFHHRSLKRVIELEKTKIKEIIFDLDGTLIQSRESIHEINRIVFSEALERHVTLEESIQKFHPEFSKLFDAYEVHCQIKQARAVSYWGEVAQRFSYDLFEGVKALLHELHEIGLTLHLWTARDEESARKILQDHRIEDYFTTLSFATEVDSKPHPKSLKFDWQSVPGHQVVLIGDSGTDIRGAKNISSIAAAALWDPHANQNVLLECGADLLFHDVNDFKKWILSQQEGA